MIPGFLSHPKLGHTYLLVLIASGNKKKVHLSMYPLLRIFLSAENVATLKLLVFLLTFLSMRALLSRLFSSA